MNIGLPQGFSIEFDTDTVQVDDGTLRGGSPARVLRLSPKGRAALDELRTGPVRSPAGAALARRLTDGGLAHPRPPAPIDDLSVTVVIPVQDRPEELRRCLAALGDAHPVVVVDDGSDDREALVDIVKAHSAELVRRPSRGGPAAARNTGLAAVDTDLVAFIDSDCVPTPDWIEALIPHFADPLVAAVAPRIVSLEATTSAGSYGEVAGSLDMGVAEGRVTPGTRISYVPSAALIVRRNALRDIGVFDERLRYGEDVDLIWRLHEAGRRIRYEPAVQVFHREPERWIDLLARRFHYGTAAAPLARRHPTAAPPLVVHPWHAATILAALTGRIAPTGLAFGASVLATRRTLRQLDLPTDEAPRTAVIGLRQTWLGLGRFMIQFTGPGLAALLVVRDPRPARRRFRRVAAASLLLGTPVTAYFTTRPRLDPIRFVLGQLADHTVYGAGVWAGCLRHRTLVPITPILARPPRRIGGATTPSTAPRSTSEGLS
ncbi:mycofactocin biosynthesis glycosyltransferase MftF [Nocardia sp. NBC_01503]|uniref:mycofactocin biosynthesis glycosyltransferase MftF n=1 Tax=Nocardia sp. NBC_01503 TaxID=2975997 RepID=UPI002E7BEE2C|nr:mycofactocin biosynthesis glycosyltransferase MftF [Nocardia sp. NBC_01503]WTL35654.1 mycofactocin biosynthesis glycosyltransferase MftF [Nocardia sp. NBC_01503]